MCEKEMCEKRVLCKKCGHGARLFHNPDTVVRKEGEHGPVVVIDGPPNSNTNPGWVVVVCQYKGCKLYNKTDERFTEKEFINLKFRPLCPNCKQEMEPDRDDNGKGNYAYRCPKENCHSHSLFAEYLPRLKK
jgi:hypothetical protein